MKKAILLLGIAAGLLSCTKDPVTTQEPATGVPMNFEIRVAETKADKTTWAEGDKIYVFFKGLAAKYLIMTYNAGTGWTSTSEGGTLLDTDFSSLETKTLPADLSLMTRITALMEERQLFLQPGLSLRDVAQALGTNVRYISDSINSSTGASFSDYVNGYRVRHAQALMQDRPGMPLSAVATESGFSSESTFFRNFKALTGKTPLQWLQARDFRI